MEEKRKIFGLIIGIIGFIAVIAGLTYAYISINTTNNSTVDASLSCVDIVYSKGTDVEVSDVNFVSGYTYSDVNTTVTFYKSNTCNSNVEGTISIYTNATTSSTLLSSGVLKYTIVKNTNPEEVFTGYINSTGDTDVNIGLLESTETTYTVYLWLEENSSVTLEDITEASYSGYVHASAKNTSTFVINPFENAVLDTEAGVDFSKTSIENDTNGVYILSGTENDTYPIYYYRGGGTDTTTGEELVKNNLIYAGFCWKIVRTTNKGGLKLIYNGVPSSGTCNNTGEDSQIGTSAFNSSRNSLAYLGYMYGQVYTHNSKTLSSDTTAYVFGNTATYSGGTYTLSNTLTTSGTWSNDYTTLNNDHYTCWTTGTTCTSLYYVYRTGSASAYYITLSGGTMVEGALSAMLDNNTTDSTIKTAVDNWYASNMTSYTNELEDAIYCNDRSISNYAGWNPNGGQISSSTLSMGPYSRNYDNNNPSLNCTRDIDQFTVSSANGNGDLTYPVGLLTEDEVALAGAAKTTNASYYLYHDSNDWTISPAGYNSPYAYVFRYSSARILSVHSAQSYSVRPVITLAKGYSISSGEGITTNPYVVN